MSGLVTYNMVTQLSNGQFQARREELLADMDPVSAKKAKIAACNKNVTIVFVVSKNLSTLEWPRKTTERFRASEIFPPGQEIRHFTVFSGLLGFPLGRQLLWSYAKHPFDLSGPLKWIAASLRVIDGTPPSS